METLFDPDEEEPAHDPNQLHLFLGQLAWNNEDTTYVRPDKPERPFYSPEVAWDGQW